jgi:hypothetical protein
VLDIKWDPFNDNIIASASDDCTVSINLNNYSANIIVTLANMSVPACLGSYTVLSQVSLNKLGLESIYRFWHSNIYMLLECLMGAI